MLTRVTRVQLKWTRIEQVQFCIDFFSLVVHFDRLNQYLDQTLASEKKKGKKKKKYLQYSVLKRSVCRIARIANCFYFRGVTSYVTQWLNLNYCHCCYTRQNKEIVLYSSQWENFLYSVNITIKEVVFFKRFSKTLGLVRIFLSMFSLLIS